MSSYDVNYVFPLVTLPSGSNQRLLSSDTEEQHPNFSPVFLKALASKLQLPQSANRLPRSVKSDDIFHYAYAVFHSPNYRIRYAEFLKIDFPRLPLTGSLELFFKLALIGEELSSFHLQESPKLNNTISKFVGDRHREIEKISWSLDTVWVDKAQKNGFQGVREDVWNFHVGGYQVCDKWLKDRKGRILSTDDIAHYQRIIGALSETIRLMTEIDMVIEQHGGWPLAF